MSSELKLHKKNQLCILSKNSRKLCVTISVEASVLSNCRIESKRIIFFPNRNALMLRYGDNVTAVGTLTMKFFILDVTTESEEMALAIKIVPD